MKVWMCGMTCLGCGKGWYPDKRTLPCEAWGHISPSSMTRKSFREAVQRRDETLRITKQ